MIGARRMLIRSMLVCGLLLTLTSCGNGRKTVYPARGQIFDNQHKPCVGAFVVFHPAGGGDGAVTTPSAYVEEDGSFYLTTYEEGDGAPAGDYIVTVMWKPRPTSALDPNRRAPDRLGGRYSNVNDSKLHFTIEPKENELPAMNLE